MAQKGGPGQARPMDFNVVAMPPHSTCLSTRFTHGAPPHTRHLMNVGAPPHMAQQTLAYGFKVGTLCHVMGNKLWLMVLKGFELVMATL